MKRITFYLTVIMTICYMPLYAQVTIGSDKAPEPFSVLEMDSKEGGIRMNQLDEASKEKVTEKLQNSSDAELTKGLSIYDMKTNRIQYWDGEKWVQAVALEAGDNANGMEGQFLRSNGKNGYPEWTDVVVPHVVIGEFYLHSSTVHKDMIGADLQYTADNMETYTEDMLLNMTSMGWVELEDLETKIYIPEISSKPGDPADKVYTRLALEMQTGAQMFQGPQSTNFKVTDSTGAEKWVTVYENPWISFAIGIFIGTDATGYMLKQVRANRVEAQSGINAFSTFTVIGAVDNLAPGEYTIKVAVKRRQQASFMEKAVSKNTILTIGKPIQGAPNYNNFMAQSFLRTDVYVVYD